MAGSRINTSQEIYQLQQALGGLGGGALAVPLWNFFDYDPRLSLMREDERFPVPGGYSFSPDRLCMGVMKHANIFNDAVSSLYRNRLSNLVV